MKGSHAQIKCSMLNFMNSKAEKGGGHYLEMDAKLCVLKSRTLEQHKILAFTANLAEYGGAVYVSDDGMCALSTNKECFFQTLALYHSMPIDLDTNDHRCQNIYFFNNTAKISGHSLYGGLLDRCRVSPLAEPNIMVIITVTATSFFIFKKLKTNWAVGTVDIKHHSYL